MFVGSINSKIRDLIYKEKALFRGRKICVGCSGNFTVEQILQDLDVEIWSNDISLYSSLVGCYLAGQTLNVRIQDASYEWIEPYIQAAGVGRIAAISLLFEMLKNEKGNNLNQIRMFEHYKNNFSEYHEKSMERIDRALGRIKINHYTMTDVHELYRTLPAEYLRIAFLPTYIGGYEKLYDRLEKVVSWQKPVYEVLDQDRYEEAVTFMRQGQFLYLSDQDRREPDLFAVVKTGRLKNVYLYSNLSFRKSHIVPTAKFEKAHYALLADDHRITEKSKITYMKTDNARMTYYKNLFLKKGIDHTTGRSPLLVAVDGYLFGFLLFDIIRYGMDQDKAVKGVYLLSDFVISSPIEKLSKLLLLCTKTKEIQQILRSALLQTVDFVLTTAFTDKPVSMKYRGVYKLIKRGSGFLQYSTPCGDITTDEAVKTWLKKYSQQ